jgi:hypothetical protein
MEKRGAGIVALVLALFLVVGVVGADWDEFVEDEENFSESDFVGLDEGVESDDETIDRSNVQGDTKKSNDAGDSNREMGDMEYTTEFYIALGVFLVAVLVILYLVYSFLKKPKNKWDK